VSAEGAPRITNVAAYTYETLIHFAHTISKSSIITIIRVRRACAESIVELAKVPHLPARLRNDKLVDLWKKLERDQMRTVKYAALQKLGYFIATFASPFEENSPPPELSGDKLAAVNELIPYFIGMAFIKTGDLQEEAEIRLHCAFCFPAVVYTVGLKGWGTLRDAFFHLAQGPEEEIPGGKANTNNTILRRCLACSLHEVAKVLGERVVEDELMPLFEAFLKDGSEDVRLSALRNFHQIIGVVSIKKREPLLELLNDMLSTSSPMNWRMRNSVARQLNQIICYFKAHSIRNKIAPLVFKLLDDPVAEVREKTYSSVPTLLKHMFWVNIVKNEVPDIFADEMDAEEWSTKAIKEVLRVLQSLPTMEDFSHRQSFCQITGCVANSVTSLD
jgi:serine/threonine-protein phosphatase 4 regulatory subunit 1